MAGKPHVYAQVASGMAEWFDRTKAQMVEGLLDRGKAPFAADISRQKQLAYYRDHIYNPDGSPNLVGRQKLMDGWSAGGDQQFALTQYAKVLDVLRRDRVTNDEPAMDEGG